jgi:DeoR/GlpR family transcriptional regulator of sugar metabolism
MLKEERQAYIIKQINLHNKVLSADLSVQLDVSEDTIRRDLNELAESGKILKVHGGALSKSFHYPFLQKEIAKKTLELIQNDMILLVGGGTTMLELARMIPEDLCCTFFTISPLVALELAEKPNLEVILLGGQLSKNAHINTGSMVISQLADIKVDVCIQGANGLSLEDGLTDSDWEVVQVKKAMLKSSNKSILICIAEKLNSTQKMKVCSLNEIDYLITDLNANDIKLSKYSKVVKVL